MEEEEEEHPGRYTCNANNSFCQYFSVAFNESYSLYPSKSGFCSVSFCETHPFCHRQPEFLISVVMQYYSKAQACLFFGG